MGSIQLRYAGLRFDWNEKSYLVLQFGELVKISPIERFVLNRPYRMYEALVMPSAKTARALARRNPLAKLSTRVLAAALVGFGEPHSELPDA